MSIIDLIKNKKIKELKTMLIQDEDINLNVKDDNYNYFIYYVLIYNVDEIIDLILSRKIRLDILDTDGRTILYIPIKFSYNMILEKLILKDSQNIGISILDIKDKVGLTAFHYSIIFNNYEGFILLLNNNTDILINNNQNINAFHICIQYGRLKFFIELVNRIPTLDFYTSNNESILQFALIKEQYDFIPIILKKKININSQDNVNGLTALHHAIIKNQKNIVIDIINYGANLNIQDYYGQTSLSYAISEKYDDIILLLLKYNPYFDLTDIDGNTPLHLYLDTEYINKDILEILILKTNLNIQNNNGITCLKRLIDLYLFVPYKHILVKKELNFYIQDHTEHDMSYIFNDSEILKIAIDSYYNIIMNKKDNLIDDWEKWCSNELLDKLKLLKTGKNTSEDICKNKIKDAILNEKRSYPKFSNLNLELDNGIFVNTCYYTGLPIDIMASLVFLHQTFNKNKFGLILDYPLTINEPLEKYYQKLGIDYPYKLEFSNCEIIWSFQKIFYPTFFDFEIQKKINEYNYLAIPIGIELINGAHANILFIDNINKTIERFEPNGINNPVGLNYNPALLDNILENKFSDYKLKYIRPSEYLPSIGFQILENIEGEKCKRLGDPNGFCGVWCIWWVYHRMKNIKINNKDLVNYLIQHIKFYNKSFKNIIRNFSQYIADVRDGLLKKVNIDINDWIVGNTNLNQINIIEKEVFKLINN